MKIVYVCNEYLQPQRCGIGTFVNSIAHGMIKAGHQVCVVGIGVCEGEYDDDGVRVVILKQSKIRGMAWWINRNRLSCWLARQAATEKIDIVEIPEFQGPLISRPGNLPVVIRLHLSATAIAKHASRKTLGLTKFCERRCLSLFRFWIPVSKYALELTQSTFGIFPSLSSVIYSPVASPGNQLSTVPELPNQFVLFAGGSVSRRKGAYILAESAKIFLVNNKDLQIVFAGSLEEEKGIKADERIRNILGSELSNRVFFTGRLSRDLLLGCMKKATVFAYPSTLETFGLVTAEAMLQGCPVVVCEIGPSTEFVEHKKTGIIVPADDTIRLAEAINWLLENKEDARQIANAGRDLILSHFNLEKCIGETINFYEQCILTTR